MDRSLPAGTWTPRWGRPGAPGLADAWRLADATRIVGTWRHPVPLGPVGWTGTVHGQSVATVFALLPLPLIPVRSVFVAEGAGGLATVVPMRRLHLGSVALAYARWWLAFGGLVGLAHTLLLGAGTWVIPVAMLVLARGLSRWRGTGRDEPARRAVLGLAAGINAPPDWLPREHAEGVYAMLEADWRCTQPTDGGASWRDVIDVPGGPDPVLAPLLFALATYAHTLTPDDATSALREAAWQVAAPAWIPFLEGRAAAPVRLSAG